MTLGEIFFRLAIAMFGLGYWGCLILGYALAKTDSWLWRKVKDSREQRAGRRREAAWVQHVDDATAVITPDLDETRVDLVAPVVRLRTAVPCRRPDGYRTGRAKVGGRR